jgi:hypothetical protein
MIWFGIIGKGVSFDFISSFIESNHKNPMDVSDSTRMKWTPICSLRQLTGNDRSEGCGGGVRRRTSLAEDNLAAL